MRARRAFHGVVPGEGATVTLAPEEAHHVASVLRLREGDAVSLFDGGGGEWDGVVVALSRHAVTVRVGARRSEPVEPPLPITLFQGLCRPDRMEWVVQKGTEIGLAAIVPTLLRRSEERAPSPDRLERWRRIAREAAKQSGRRVVPEVREASVLPGAPEPGAVGILLDGSATAPLAARLAAPAPRAVGLLVGPEGGLEPEESAALARDAWIAASLGPRILRTETAGLVAAALILSAWGDLAAPVDPSRTPP